MGHCGGRTRAQPGAWGRTDVSLTVPAGRRGEKATPSSQRAASALAEPRAGPGRTRAALIHFTEHSGKKGTAFRASQLPAWECRAQPAGVSPSIPAAQHLLGTGLCLQQFCGRAGTYAKCCQGGTYLGQGRMENHLALERLSEIPHPTALPLCLKFHH